MLQFIIDNGAYQGHPEQMPSATVAIGIRHAFECLDARVDMLNHYSFPGKPSVVCFLPFVQRMVLACLCGDFASGMIRLYPLIPAVRLQHDLLVQRRSHAPFIQLEIMLGSAPLPYIQYLPGSPVDYHLRFYRVPLLFPGIIALLFFLGRSIGLSVTSTTT